MPHLKVCKRTWKRSEDEFVISSIVQALIRVILVVIAGALLLSNQQLQTVCPAEFKGILITSAVICILHILLFIVIAAVSGRGGVMEVQKRKPLGPLIIVHFLLMILELIFYCLSIWQVVVFRNDHSYVDLHSAFVAVICWCSVLMFTIVCEIVDWIRHYDKDGRLKYEFYNTFLYDGVDKKTEDEKRELVMNMRMVEKFKWQNVLSKKFDSPEDYGSDDKEAALHAVSTAFVDLLT
ncbi:unnamed protein product, partial [Hydatigera taeniaeformis]|uniref:Tobamovirus multiplication protein 1-like n=1 Tax=Hydatigena taeniaeformis TaxID=6205 RepID=A0A0R3XD11_HYDTA